MLSSNHIEPSAIEVCDYVKKLGFAAPHRVRLYGEEFEVVSDPFLQEDGIAVHAKPVRAGARNSVRVLKLPATITHSVKGKIGKAA
jgi:hypothetical protein